MAKEANSDEDKTKEQLINELVKLRQRITELETSETQRKQMEKQRVCDLEFLSKTAMEFIELSPEQDIYRFIGERLKELVGDSIVGVNSFDGISDKLCTHALLGIEDKMDNVLKIFGRALVGTTFEIDDEAKAGLISGNLTKVPGGIYGLSPGIPKIVCHALERLLGLGDVYAVGFSWGGKLFGSVAILLHRKTELRNQSIIEAFVRQASVALQRNRAEEELRKAHDELEIRVQQRTAELSKANEALRAEITERKQAEEALQESNRRLKEALVELQRRAEELLALQKIATSIQSSLELNEILQQAAEGIVKGLEYNSAYIMLLDEDEEFFKGAVFSTKSGIAEKIEKVIGFSLTELRIPASYNEATGNALDGRITIKHHLHEIAIPPLNKVACFALQKILNTKTIITVPLFVTGVETPAYKKVIGGLLATTRREELTEREINSLLSFANGIGIAIEKARLFGEITRLYQQQKNISEELQQSYALLDEKNKELQSFVYTVSHDLKAPLVSLEGFASMLLGDKYKESIDETGQLYLLRIQANVENMGSLIQDLLELSRIGRIVHDYESVDVTEIIQEAIETLRIQLLERGTEWIIQEDLPIITCDRVRIKQVFENLIDNANKFMGEENDKPRIEIGFHEAEDFFEFFVKDNGIGIQKEYQEKVFEIFARLGDVEVEGTGVGLTIVKKIIENHGGEIWIDSEVGKGTTVYFTLPKSVTNERESNQNIVNLVKEGK